MVRILSILLIIGLSCFAVNKDDTALKIMAKYDGQNVLIKWVPPYLSNDYEYKIYRTAKDGQKKLIQKQKKKTYKYVKNNLSKELANIVYPYKNVNTLDERIRTAIILDSVQAMKNGVILRNNDLAKALGVYFVDSSVRMKQKYRYDIEVYEKGKLLGSNSLNISTFKVLNPKTITNLKVTNSKDYIALKWDLASVFDTYNVYRKAINSSKYIKLNKNKIIVKRKSKYYFKDQNLKPNTMYQYVVTTVDPFDYEGEYSLPVTGYLKIDQKSNPIKKIDTVVTNSYIKLIWNKVKQKDIAYNVYRSVELTAGYKKLNKKLLKKNIYIDKNFLLNRNYYYYITVVKNKTESKPSAKKLVSVRDVTPPETPKNFKIVTKPGKFVMSWDKVKQDDLLGYRVYRSMDEYSKHWEMINKKDIKQNSFIHKVPKTLSRNFYYYKVTAVDKNFNESKPSKVIKIKLPDITPPSEPVIINYKVYNDTLFLEWKNVIVYDLSHYNIYTQIGKKLVKLNKKPILFTKFEYNLPKNIQGQKKYIVTAVDKSGNESSKENFVLINHKDTVAPKIENIKYQIQKNQVKISFEVKDDDYNGFEIFRSSGKNKKYYNISTFQRGMSYIDKKLDIKRVYFYQIRVYDKAGNVRISDTKEISWKK